MSVRTSHHFSPVWVRLCLSAAWALTLSVPQAAWGQAIGERSPLTIDEDEDRLEFQQEQAGIRAGAFQVRPSGLVAAAADSNIFAAPGERSEQALTLAEALVRLDNDPGDLDSRSRAFVRARQFLDAHDQDTTEFGAASSLRAQLGAQDEITGRLLAQRRFESRAEIETPDSRAVSFYREFRGDLAYAHAFNRFALRTSLSGRRLDYEDDSQSFRNRWFYRAELRGSYELRSGFALVGTSYYSRDDFEFSSPLVASAETVGTLLGARLSVPDVIDFELAGGYFQRSFAGQVDEISGVSLRGTVTWRPTRLMSVRAELLREDEPTRVLGAFGKIRTNGSLALDHQYSSRLNFYARGRVILDDFDAIQRTDKTYLTEIGLNYLLARRYVIKLEHDFASRSSGAASQSFVRHVTSVSFIGRF